MVPLRRATHPPASGLAGAAPVQRPRAYVYISAAAVVGVFFGFSFTYWGPLLAGTDFTGFVHVHAALWFGWFVLFAAQALLVDRGRVQWHRTLGVGGAVYTLALIGVSLALALRTIARDVDLISGGFEAVPTIIPLSQIVMFAAFFSAAIFARDKPQTHKRLVVLAALVGSTPAIARISIGTLGFPHVPLILAASNLLVVGVVVADRLARGAFHPIYLWGGASVILVRLIRIPIAMSPAWRWFAEQLVTLTA